MIDTICIETSFNGREMLKVLDAAPRLGYQVRFGTPESTIGCCPLGTVDFCEDWLGYHPKPDFYPDFLERWLFRDVAIGPAKCRGNFPQFVKSAEQYKAFPAKVYQPDDRLPDGLLCRDANSLSHSRGLERRSDRASRYRLPT
jgi:hypothetical protein